MPKEISDKLYKLESINEREEFFDNIWSSPVFKSKKAQFFLTNIKNNFIKFPRYYYQMQDQELERAAFTSWYNVLSLKDYKNPYIKDLYYLHELSHIATMPYNPQLNFLEWSLKMRENEVMASMLTEVFIYFEFPELRKHTMNHEIWVDRYLREPFINMNNTMRFMTLMTERHNAYLNPKDIVEQELHFFKKFSHLFYKVWKNDFKKIEEAVSHLKKTGNEVVYEDFLKSNLSKNNILFEDKIKIHYQNYIKNKFKRDNY